MEKNISPFPPSSGPAAQWKVIAGATLVAAAAGGAAARPAEPQASQSVAPVGAVSVAGVTAGSPSAGAWQGNPCGYFRSKGAAGLCVKGTWQVRAGKNNIRLFLADGTTRLKSDVMALPATK